MRVAIGADHAGFALKQHLIGCLAEAGHETSDLGTFDQESVDYPDFGRKVARAIASGAAERGVVICGTGIGISIAANKVAGVRAARCTSEYDARYARAHNDANVLAIGARVTGFGLAEAILATFFETEFEGGRHARRVGRMED
jgi:ribose 5-phosphate isomerase B